jgi:hypothetical protein
MFYCGTRISPKFIQKNYYTFRDFEGYKRNSVFYTRRILKQGMNSFIPMTEIQVNSQNKGSAVELTFKMQILTIVLSTVFYGFQFISILIKTIINFDEDIIWNFGQLILVIAFFMVCSISKPENQRLI